MIRTMHGFRRDPRNSILARARTTQTLLPHPADDRCHGQILLRFAALPCIQTREPLRCVGLPPNRLTYSAQLRAAPRASPLV